VPNNSATISAAECRRVRSAIVGGTHVIYVLHDATDPNATAAEEPTSLELYVWKCCSSRVGTFALFVSRRDRALHHSAARGATELRRRRARCRHQRLARSNGLTTKPATPLNTQAKPRLSRELLRHPVYTRVLHWRWPVLLSCAFTGFGIYLPCCSVVHSVFGADRSAGHASVFRVASSLLRLQA